MTDARGLQHPLGIETVHWSAGTGSDLLVRVAGRWRRRWTATTVPAVLAIDTEHGRHRFPAQPEPPSVRGAQPGVWQVGFTVPAALAPYLAGRLILILGSVSIPLPPAVADPAAAGPAIPDGPEPIVVTDRRDRHAESEAKQRLVDRLERELAHAARESEQLRTELELAERDRRQAEQLAHSEAAMRLDLERDHDVRMRRHQADARSVLELLEAVQLHARDLGHEFETLRRSADQAAEPVRASSERSRGHALAAELAIAKSAPPAPGPMVITSSSQVPGLALELAMCGVHGAGRRHPWSIDREREHALAGALLPHPHPPGLPPGGVAPDRLAAALYRLRDELPALEPEPGAEGWPADPPAAVAPRNAAAELAAALEVTTSVAPPPATRPTGRWLLRALKRLLREDPAAVGRLVIHLLPAQILVSGGAIRYDIALSGAGCWAVTVTGGEVRLAVLAARRESGEVAFTVEGDMAELGRLLVYGRMRRRLSRRVARVRGDRSRLVSLDRLVREPLGLGELYAAGVRLDPELVLLLVAYMIDPSWTAAERFTVGHESPGGGGRVYLLVRDGTRPRVSHEPPLGPVTTTIRCADERLLAVLTGGSEAGDTVRGAAAPLTLLSRWIARAQRDS